MISYIDLRGRTGGHGALLWNGPTPLTGGCSVSGFLLTEHQLPAICPCPCSTMAKYRFGQELQAGDLGICFKGPGGNPIVPTDVTYTLYMVRPEGTFQQVGPSGRTPAQGPSQGCFYVTGDIGCCGGQPGPWAVTWRYRRSSYDPWQEQTMRFGVLDAVLARDPNDELRRCRKYGWD